MGQVDVRREKAAGWQTWTAGAERSWLNSCSRVLVPSVCEQLWVAVRLPATPFHASWPRAVARHPLSHIHFAPYQVLLLLLCICRRK